MELHKPQGFNRGGPAVNFQQLAMNNQSKQNDQGIMTVTRPSGMQENIQVQERTPTQDANITESIISSRDNQKALAEEQENTGIMSLEPTPNEIEVAKQEDKRVIRETQEAGKQAQQNPSLFSDGEKKGLFAANLALALAQPGDPMANLAMGLGKGAISLAELNQEERKILNEQKKLGKGDFFLDTVTGKTYKVENKRAMTEFIQNPVTGVMEPRFVKPETGRKSDNVILQKMVNGKKKDIVRPDYIDYMRGDFSKYPEGSITDLPTDDVPRMILEDSIFGKEGEVKYFSPEVANDNKDVLGKEISAAKLAEIAEREVYRTAKVKSFQTRFDEAKSLGKKTNEAAFLIKDISERLDLGAKGGVLNRISQGIQQMKAAGKFLVGIDDEGNRIEVDLEDVGNKGALYDPTKAENYADVTLAFTNPEAYITKMTEDRKMTLKEQKAFRQTVGAFSKEFAEMNAGLQTNVIQLAYAIAKANEEGGRFSVSDIQFAMDSIGSGLDVGIFKSKLNTVAQRLTANSYNSFQQFFQDFEDDPLQDIQDEIERFKGKGFYKSVKENFDYFNRGPEYIKERQRKKEEELKKRVPSPLEILQKQNEDKGK